jgi:transcription antitermination factor NusA-like protein
MIARCLKPAIINSITISGKKATVMVNEDQKAIAIGKGASNVKLASQITGLSIDVK